MDNITHSLVGVALADVMMGGRSTRSQRPLFAGAGIVAANLPDIDLAYSAITPAPIGYLLHHRGHTHTLIGVCALALVLIVTYRSVPPVRAMRTGDRLRLWGVIALGLGSHLAMDALNSYGVHPWHPFDSRWYFGDALFIFEPALWIVLGLAAAWNGRGAAARLAASVPLLLVLGAVALAHIVPIDSLAALAAVGAVFTWMARGLSAKGRAGLALAAATLIVAALMGVSGVARAEARRALERHVVGRLVDIILTPNPSSPICWEAIGVELNEAGGEYVLWRGTLTLAPRLKPAASCASHRFAGGAHPRMLAGGRLALGDEIHQSLARLRELSRGDCWVRAWLRFGRAPLVADGAILDLRFARRGAPAFTRLPLARRAGEPSCPGFVPGWGMPRADLLGR